MAKLLIMILIAGLNLVTQVWCAPLECYLRMYQIRYAHESLGAPLKGTPVEFTIGPDQWKNLPNYYYVSFSSIGSTGQIYRIKKGRESSHDLAVALSDSELLRLYGDRSMIPLWELRKADIEKFHRAMIMTHPDWYPYGKDLCYGVKVDGKGQLLRDEKGRPAPDSPLEYYQQGRTVVQPTSYNDNEIMRFHMNLNNPTVREYVARQILQLKKLNKDNLIFIDNTIIQSWQLYDTRTKEDYRYIGPGSREEQAEIYAKNSCAILKEIKRRGDNPGILLNGMRDQHALNENFYHYLLRDENASCFDGVMFENKFWKDDDWYGGGKYLGTAVADAKAPGLKREPWCTNIGFYQEWVKRFKAKGKKVLFCALVPAGPPDDIKNEKLAERLWLWFHLVADENTLFFMNDAYIKPMREYGVYARPLGKPLGAARKEGDVWKRDYEGGRVELDVRSGKLQEIRLKNRDS